MSTSFFLSPKGSSAIVIKCRSKFFFIIFFFGTDENSFCVRSSGSNNANARLDLITTHTLPLSAAAAAYKYKSRAHRHHLSVRMAESKGWAALDMAANQISLSRHH